MKLYIKEFYKEHLDQIFVEQRQQYWILFRLNSDGIKFYYMGSHVWVQHCIHPYYFLGQNLAVSHKEAIKKFEYLLINKTLH